MSHAAEAWFFDECMIRGSEGWVLVTLCNAADDDGLAAQSKRSLVAKTHLHETTIWRALHTMRDDGVIEFVEGETGPVWWTKIPVNRRPRLLRLSAFLGSRFATPGIESGVAQGSRKRAPGVAQGSRGTPADLPVRDASLDPEIAMKGRAREADPKCVQCQGRGVKGYAPADDPKTEPARPIPCDCTHPDYQAPAERSKPPPDFGLAARKGA